MSRVSVESTATFESASPLVSPTNASEIGPALPLKARRVDPRVVVSVSMKCPPW